MPVIEREKSMNIHSLSFQGFLAILSSSIATPITGIVIFLIIFTNASRKRTRCKRTDRNYSIYYSIVSYTSLSLDIILWYFLRTSSCALCS